MIVRRSIFVVVLLALAPALLIQGLNEFELRKSREAEVSASALRLARFGAGELGRILDSVKIVVSSLAELPAVRREDAAECETFAKAIVHSTDFLSTIGVVARDGRLLCTTATRRGVNFSDRPYFKRALAAKAPIVGEFTVGRLLPSAVLPIAAPFKDQDGQVAGVVFASIKLDWLASYFETRGLSRDTATILVADRDGTILVRVPDQERWVGKKLSDTYLREVYAAEPGTKEIVGVDGVRRILGYTPIADEARGVYVGVALTKASAFASIEQATIRGWSFIAAGALCAIGLAYVFGRVLIVQPVEKLTDAARKWGQGRLGVRTGLAGQGEFGELGRTFDAMASEIQAATDRLKERVEQETEARLSSEKALQHLEKMDTLGRLAGGIAHDFNNCLQVIMASLDRLKRRAALLADESKSQRDAQLGLLAATQAAELVQRMLAFARRQPLQRRAFDANQVIEELSQMLRRTLGEAVQIQSRPAAGLWPVLADRTQLETCLLNLAVNARDAMPKGGVLTLETANCSLDDTYAAAHPEAQPGDYVLFSVSDTGVGMSPETLAHAFDPFFTTKEPGKGTGLGLSQVYGFAQQSKGHVRISSELGHGTTVKLYLPRAEALPAPAVTELSAPGARGSGQTILVVEDEPGVLEYSQRILSEEGYRVLTATDGPKALLVLDREPDVAILFTDVGLPGGLTGPDLAEKAVHRRPQLKVLYATGYERSALVRNGQLDPRVELLTKPFTSEELTRRVARLLSA
jgi:signal transduction histidine kinase